MSLFTPSGTTLSRRSNTTPGLDSTHIYATSSSRASPNPFASAPATSEYSKARTAEELESQNEDALEGLQAKVKLLKDITIGIGNEVRDSTKLLNGMNDTFSETSGLLGGTFHRMKNMAKRTGGRWWYWMLFLTLVFWIFVLRWLRII